MGFSLTARKPFVFARGGNLLCPSNREPAAMSDMVRDERQQYEGGEMVGIDPGMPSAVRAPNDRRSE